MGVEQWWNEDYQGKNRRALFYDMHLILSHYELKADPHSKKPVCGCLSYGMAFQLIESLKNPLQYKLHFMKKLLWLQFTGLDISNLGNIKTKRTSKCTFKQITVEPVFHNIAHW
jgi:uncharacterized lipoprotein YehR (DUF1307 family)